MVLHVTAVAPARGATGKSPHEGGSGLPGRDGSICWPTSRCFSPCQSATCGMWPVWPTCAGTRTAGP